MHETTPMRSISHRRATAAGPMQIALVNNMPDSALLRTERQFAALFAAALHRPVELAVYALPSIPRGPVGLDYVATRTLPIAELWRRMPAAIVITGAEPRHRDLCDEAFWGDLVALFAQADSSAVPCFLSCLAAHAAAHALDGVQRRRLPGKCFGVFDEFVTATHFLADGCAKVMALPHSRWNELPEAELRKAGYQVVSRSPEAGVGLFTRQRRNIWLFCQGHPEYDDVNLLREYRRDVSRYLLGQQAQFPDPPRHYFDSVDSYALQAFRARALVTPEGSLMAIFPQLAPPRLTESARRPALSIIRNWLDVVEAHGIAGARIPRSSIAEAAR